MTVQDPISELGGTGTPCRACGAPLAADQRYCVSCGERRGDARVDYLTYLRAPADGVERQAGPAAGAAPIAATAPGGRAQRDYAPLAAVGGIVVLGLILLVGVLIGRGANETPTAAAPPQVVTVSGSTTTAEPETTTSPGSAEAGETAAADPAEEAATGSETGGRDPAPTAESGKGSDDQAAETAATVEALDSASTEDK